jgi:hypothetical protein
LAMGLYVCAWYGGEGLPERWVDARFVDAWTRTDSEEEECEECDGMAAEAPA